jgi:glycosyltransferase involved in cell wall biosynthesis
VRVLHLSADYPDPLAPGKTRAVSNLLELTRDAAEHRVYSLNRVGWRLGTRALGFDDAAGAGHRAVAYGAPGRGILLRARLEALADWILADMARDGFVPDAVHAHKLSVEGIAGLKITQALGAPLLISIQGNSDLKILGARPDLRRLWRRIWREAAAVFPFAPWAARGVEGLLGPREGPVVPLPVPGPADARMAPRVVGPLIRSAFHLAAAANKNAAALIRATGRAGAQVPDLALEIVGGGDAGAFAALAAEADRAAPGRVRFAGPAAHGTVQQIFNASGGFALVSHRESFGMVFAEALLAGAPCLIPRGRAIDGWFEEGGVVLAADPKDEGEIAEGLVRLAREEAALKARLAALGEAGGLDFLRRDAIAATYRAVLAGAVAGSGSPSKPPSTA